jgi:hypothetical protein
VAWKQKINARESYSYGEGGPSGNPYLVVNDSHSLAKVDLGTFEGSTPFVTWGDQGPYFPSWIYATYTHSTRPDNWYFITADYDTGDYAFFEFNGRTGVMRSLQFSFQEDAEDYFDATGVALENFGMRSNIDPWYEDAWAHDETFSTVYLISYNSSFEGDVWGHVAVIDIDNWTIEFHMNVALPDGVEDGNALSNLVILEGELYAWDPVNEQSVKFNGTDAWVPAAYPWATTDAPSFSTYGSGPKIISPYQASGGYVTADRLYYKDYFGDVGDTGFGPHIAWWDVDGFHYVECPWPEGYDTGDGLDAKGMIKVGSKYVFISEQGWDCVCVFDPSTDTLSAFSTGIPVNWDASRIFLQLAAWDDTHFVIVITEPGYSGTNETEDNAVISYYVVNIETGTVAQEAGPEHVIATNNDIDYGLSTLIPFEWNFGAANGWEHLLIAPENGAFFTETGISKIPFNTGIVGYYPDSVPQHTVSGAGAAPPTGGDLLIVTGDNGRLEFYDGSNVVYITIPLI